jgi:hypothetical protein
MTTTHTTPPDFLPPSPYRTPIQYNPHHHHPPTNQPKNKQQQKQDPPLSSPSGFGRFACDNCVQDYVNGARSVRELYEMARDVNGKFTVRAFMFLGGGGGHGFGLVLAVGNGVRCGLVGWEARVCMRKEGVVPNSGLLTYDFSFSKKK